MTALLDVRPAGFFRTATLLGGDAADGVAAAWSSLLFGLKTVQGMAGTDDVGAGWGHSYDASADAVRAATRDVALACRRLAGLVEQTGLNFAGAEAWSTPSSGPRTLAESARERTVNRWTGDDATDVVAVPTAVGVAMPAPKVWSVVAHAVGRLWPDGHQDELRAAADAWRAAAGQVESLAPVVGSAAREMLCQVCPESGAAFTAIDSLIPHFHTLGNSYRRLGDSCDQYAGHLDAAHHAILAELRSFLEWTGGIEATSALLSVITFGASELAGQAGESIEIARAAKVIKKIIDTLEAVMTAVRAEVAAIGADVAALPDQLAALLRIRVAGAEFAPTLRVEMATEDLRLANPELIPTTAAATGPTRAIANLERSEAQIAELSTKIRDPKLFDPESLRGMTEDEVRALIPKDWKERPAAKGDGVVYDDFTHRGRQIRVMKGYSPGTRAEPITHGPYAVISQNGGWIKIPLAGNPVLR